MMASMIRPDLSQLPAYIPGKTVPGALKLASNETAEAPLPSIIEAVSQAAGTLNRYPPMANSPLHQAIAEFHGVAVDNVAIGCGSVALLGHLVQATCEAGQEVLYAWRSFEAYPILTHVAGARSVQVPLTPDFRHDLPAMAAAITERTSLVMICNPNNPTGTIIEQAELEEFLAAVPPRVTVCIDEAYIDYVAPELRLDVASVMQQYSNVLIARTFSKCYGLAGARVGYMVGAPELIAAVNKVVTPFSVNSLAHAGAQAALAAQDEVVARVAVTRAQRTRVRDYLVTEAEQGNAWGMTLADVPETHTNFLWVALPGQGGAPAGAAGAGGPGGTGPAGLAAPEGLSRAEAFDQALREAGVIVRCFPGDGVRITVTNEEETDVLLGALGKVFAQ